MPWEYSFTSVDKIKAGKLVDWKIMPGGTQLYSYTVPGTKILSNFP